MMVRASNEITKRTNSSGNNFQYYCNYGNLQSTKEGSVHYNSSGYVAEIYIPAAVNQLIEIKSLLD